MIEPLLLIRSTGSILVERVGKPLKNNVWSKLHNSLGQDKAEVCLSVGLNLRYLMKIRSSYHKQANENALEEDDNDLYGAITM